MPALNLRIGTAGWSIPRDQARHFPGDGPHLDRYAAAMPCAEINSTFYRAHRPATYARWAAATPASFRFSVKVPKAITHESALNPTPAQLQAFLADLQPLDAKLGPLLLQLPPKQGFSEATAGPFLTLLRACLPHARFVIEPRHPQWFTAEAAALLRELAIPRVIADPPRPGDDAPTPAPTGNLVYFRLHGSPRVYYSSYSQDYLENLATTIHSILSQPRPSEVWCIFDNTASGAALGDALRLHQAILAL